jgi:hypothetical protein
MADFEQLVRYVYLVAILMAARAVSVAVTVFPPSDPLCQADSLVLLHGGCRDKMFSGHAAYMTLSALFLLEHPGRARRSGLILAFLIALESVYLVAAREHFTADILIAIVVAFLLYRACCGRPTA